MADILIVIDMQNDFISGSLGTPEAVAIVPAVKEKIEQYRKSGRKIYFTRDTHTEDYLKTFEGRHLPVEHCIKGTWGWQIAEELETEDAIVVNKPTFGYEDWKDTLPDFESVEVCGLCTDICVISNVLILRAAYPEKEIIVDASCCAGVTPAKHEAALEVMRSCQVTVIDDTV